jgi:hypothetical protein
MIHFVSCQHEVTRIGGLAAACRLKVDRRRTVSLATRAGFTVAGAPLARDSARGGASASVQKNLISAAPSSLDSHPTADTIVQSFEWVGAFDRSQ